MVLFEPGEVIETIYSAFNRGRLDVVRSLATDQARLINIPFGITLPYVDSLKSWRAAFPDANIRLQTLATAESGNVIAELRARGRHGGALRAPAFEIPPTNRRVDMRFVGVYE